jgi:hypothetical protein
VVLRCCSEHDALHEIVSAIHGTRLGPAAIGSALMELISSAGSTSAGDAEIRDHGFYKPPTPAEIRDQQPLSFRDQNHTGFLRLWHGAAADFTSRRTIIVLR